MTTKQQIIVGIFQDRAQAEEAVHELLQAGFAHHQVHFASREPSTGGILEKIKNLFTGQDTSAGGLYNDLINMGAPAEDARYYQNEFNAGRSIVVVQTPNRRMQDVTSMLMRHGGYGAGQRSAQQATGYGTPGTPGVPGVSGVPGTPDVPGAPAAPSTPETSGSMAGPIPEEVQRVKLREEELRVRKQTVETGEARLRKEVVVEEKSIDVPVMHEEVYIERLPGSGQPSDQPIGEGTTYRIPVYEEQVTVEKVPVEREEVVFGKRPVQETQRVKEAVQREEARVEHKGDVSSTGQDVEQKREY